MEDTTYKAINAVALSLCIICFLLPIKTLVILFEFNEEREFDERTSTGIHSFTLLPSINATIDLTARNPGKQKCRRFMVVLYRTVMMTMSTTIIVWVSIMHMISVYEGWDTSTSTSTIANKLENSFYISLAISIIGIYFQSLYWTIIFYVAVLNGLIHFAGSQLNTSIVLTIISYVISTSIVTIFIFCFVLRLLKNKIIHVLMDYQESLAIAVGFTWSLTPFIYNYQELYTNTDSSLMIWGLGFIWGFVYMCLVESGQYESFYKCCCCDGSNDDVSFGHLDLSPY